MGTVCESWVASGWGTEQDCFAFQRVWEGPQGQQGPASRCRLPFTAEQGDTELAQGCLAFSLLGCKSPCVMQAMVRDLQSQSKFLQKL